MLIEGRRYEGNFARFVHRRELRVLSQLGVWSERGVSPLDKSFSPKDSGPDPVHSFRSNLIDGGEEMVERQIREK